MSASLATPALPRYAGRLLRWKTATVVSAMVSLWVTMAETDRLVAGAVPAGSGESRTASGLQGPDAAALTDSWTLWQGLGQPQAAELGRYLQAYEVSCPVSGGECPAFARLLAALRR